MNNNTYAKIYASLIAPNPSMDVLWMDLNEDPKGSIIKFWDGERYIQLAAGNVGDPTSILQYIDMKDAANKISILMESAEYSDYLFGLVDLGSYMKADASNSSVNKLKLNKDVSWQTPSEGELIWNKSAGSLAIGLGGGNYTHSVGFELLYKVYNNSGVDISAGDLVSVTGADPGTGRLYIRRAQAGENPSVILGLASKQIINGTSGFVLRFGMVNGVKSNGVAGQVWSSGNILYQHPSVNGKLSNVAPTSPSNKMPIGYVVIAHETNGSIFVDVKQSINTSNISDFNIISPLDGDVIVYDSATESWKNLKSVKLSSVIPPSGTLSVTGNLSVSGTVSSNSVSSNSITSLGEVYAQGGFHVIGETNDDFVMADGDTLPISNLKSGIYELYNPSNSSQVVLSISANGEVVISGDIIQNGGAYDLHAENINTPQELITLREGALSSMPIGALAGFIIKNYDGHNDGMISIDRNGILRIGDVGDLQPVMTREESPVEYSPLHWNSSSLRAETLPSSTEKSSISVTDKIVIKDTEDANKPKWVSWDTLRNDALERAEEAVVGAESARDLAEKWASEEEDVIVAGDKYSAMHYALKSQEYSELFPDEVARLDLRIDLTNEETDTKLGFKVDGAFSENGLLYLTSNGAVVAGPIEVGTGTGGSGGGGGSIMRVLSISPSLIVAGTGTDVNIEYSFSSIDSETEVPTGNGTVILTVNSIQREVRIISQGNHSFDITQYLSQGTNSASIRVSDSYGATRTINYTINVVNLTLQSSFDWKIPQEGAISFRYTPIGQMQKTIRFWLDDVELTPVTTSISNQQLSYSIPAQSHGNHKLRVKAEATYSGVSIESNELFYDIICLEEGNNTPIIAFGGKEFSVGQYASLQIPYVIYTPASELSSATIEDNDVQISSLSNIDRSINYISYRADNDGVREIKVTSGATSRSVIVNVGTSIIQFEAETVGLELHMSPVGRTNNDSNRNEWVYEGIESTLTDFNFVNNGWLPDAFGDTVLRVSSGANVYIPFMPFATDFRPIGKTIEIEFSTKDVLDYEQPIIHCFSGNRGIQITPQKSMFRSANNTVESNYKDEERIRISFVVTAENEGRLIYTYINGIISGIKRYEGGGNPDSFNQITPVGITINGGSNVVDIYNIRVYNDNLSPEQILNNYIADLSNLEKKLELYYKNNITDEFGNIPYTKLIDPENPYKIPVMIVTGELPPAKKDRRPLDIEYIDPFDPANNFIMIADREPGEENADVQGTSSAVYPRKNYKFKWHKGDFYQAGRGTVYTDGLSTTIKGVGTRFTDDNLASKAKIAFGSTSETSSATWYNISQIISDTEIKINTAVNLNEGTLYTVKPNKGYYKLRENSIPARVFTMKADFAESSGTHNTGMAVLAHEVLTEMGFRTPPQISDVRVRTTVDGFPIVMYHRPTPGSTPYFLGKYNFNTDKDAIENYGFDENNPDNISMEFTNNASKLDLFQDDNFYTPESGSTTIPWRDAFEARFPEEPDPADYDNTSEYEADMSVFMAKVDKFRELFTWFMPCRTTFAPKDFNGKLSDLTLSHDITREYLILDETDTEYFGHKASFDQLTNSWVDAGVYSPMPSPVEYAGVVYTYDTENYRTAKFRAEASQHFNMNFLISYYLLTELFGMTDQRAKNMFLATWGKEGGLYHKWYPTLYDNDTMAGIKNTGEIAFDYTIETNSFVNGAYAYNGYASELWIALEKAFPTEIATIYTNMRQVLDYQRAYDSFMTNQSDKWSETIYNEDAKFKYVDSLLSGLGNYLANAQGSRADHRKWWFFNRFRYLDSKYGVSGFLSDAITIRINNPDPKRYVLSVTDFTAEVSYDYRVVIGSAEYNIVASDLTDGAGTISIKLVSGQDTVPSSGYFTYKYKDNSIDSGSFAYTLSETILNDLAIQPSTNFQISTFSSQYISVKYSNLNPVKVKTAANVIANVTGPNLALNDFETSIYGASNIKDIKLLPSKYIGFMDFSKATKLRELVIGDSTPGYINLALGSTTPVDLTTLVLLRKVDIRNCPNVRGALDLSNSQQIEEVYLTGTNVSSVSIPNGGRLSKMHLPAVQSLTIRNQNLLTNENLILDFSKLDRVRIENSNGLDIVSFMRECIDNSPNLDAVRLIGIDSEGDVDVFLDLRSYRGLNENNGIIPVAVVTGNHYAEEINISDLDSLNFVFPQLNISYGELFLSFLDPVVTSTAISSWGADVEGRMSMSQIHAITNPGNSFRDNTSIVSFNEFEYFTGITTLPLTTFRGTTNLKHIKLPSSLTSIGKESFLNSGITGNLIIPSSVQSIGESAFRGCSGLIGNLVIPNGVTSIGNNAFQNCSGLNSFEWPESLTSMPDNLLAQCTGLQGMLTIRDSVTSIGAFAFLGCTGITGLVLSSNLNSLGQGSFQDCTSLAGSIYIPVGVTSIPTTAFRGTKIQSCIFGGNLISIGTASFHSCTQLDELIIPATVTSIGEQAFGFSAFSSNKGHFKFEALTPINTPGGITIFHASSNYKIHVPAVSLYDYMTATNWSTFISAMRGFEVIEEGVAFPDYSEGIYTVCRWYSDKLCTTLVSGTASATAEYYCKITTS